MPAEIVCDLAGAQAVERAAARGKRIPAREGAWETPDKQTKESEEERKRYREHLVDSYEIFQSWGCKHRRIRLRNLCGERGQRFTLYAVSVKRTAFLTGHTYRSETGYDDYDSDYAAC
jgi:hypothetical protein